MGRKKGKGNRSPSGRLKKASTVAARLCAARDYGSDFTQRRRAMFDCIEIKGGKAVDEVHDGIGQLWAVGMLDGNGFCDKEMMRAGRDYARLYWRTYNATAPKTGKLEPASRTSDSGDIPPEQAWERLYARMENILDGMDEERAALTECCVDPWFSDGKAGFAVRLVNAELHKIGRGPEFCELPTLADVESLKALIRALCALVDGMQPSRNKLAA